MASSPTDDAPLLLFSPQALARGLAEERVQAGSCRSMLEPGSTLPAAAIGGAAEAMHYRHNWPTRGRPPVCRLRRADAGIAPAHV
jgi:hypothetical protein